MTDHSWRERAACRGLHPNLFHGERGDSHQYRNAISICNGDLERPPCPVKHDCLNWILAILNNDNDLHGIYGGLLPRERAELRRETGNIRHRRQPGRPPKQTTQPDIERENLATPPSQTHERDIERETDAVAWLAGYESDLLARLESEQLRLG